MAASSGLPNNSFNPTALSLPFFMMVMWLRLVCAVSSGGGLIRALDLCALCLQIRAASPESSILIGARCIKAKAAHKAVAEC